MVRELTPEELQNDTEEIIRALEDGESFLLTLEGRPIADLTPVRRTFVPVEDVKRIFAGAPRIDYAQFRRDLDKYIDQDPTPRF